MGAKAMCVDDSASIRKLVQKALQPAGFEVVEAENGRAALAHADSTIDIFFVDVNMPEMDGFQFVSAMRKQPELSGKPVVFLTTESSKERKAQGKELGANGWIVKPFTPEDLSSVALTLTRGKHGNRDRG